MNSIDVNTNLLSADNSDSGVGVEFEFCDFENPEHLNALAELTNLYMADPMGEAPPHDKLHQLRLIDGLANHPSVLILFEIVAGKAIGLATCFINFSTFMVKPYLNIHDFFVHPEFRGRGYAKRLMEELIVISTTRGYGKINLEVREDNLIAQQLYRQLGFDECKPNMLFWMKKINL